MTNTVAVGAVAPGENADHLRGATKLIVPEGWKLVPVEPTREIRKAIDLLCDDHSAFDDSEAFWQYLLAAAPAPDPASPWISVEDRLPDESAGTVAVFFDDGQPGVAWATYWSGACTDFAQWTYPLDELGEDREVTHWMPLPSAPEQPAKVVL